MTPDALLKQLARDIRAWERAEGIEIVQAWLNGWGYWVAEWRKLAGKRGRDQYDYYSARGSTIPFAHLIDEELVCGDAARGRIVARKEVTNSLRQWPRDRPSRPSSNLGQCMRDNVAAGVV